jgi:15-cis-phytoene synthase/lycopene beta-cyclase
MCTKRREVDMRMLASIVYLDETLRDEARISHLHSPRIFSIPYLVINSWYLCVMRLVRDDTGADVYGTRRRTIAAIKLFLVQAYDEQTPALERVFTLCTIPHATPKDHAVFYLFATLLPRLVPIYPFLELCEGVAVDAAFMPDSNVALAVRIAEKDFDLDAHLPIHTRDQLKAYTTAVYGSFVAAYVYLSWAVLTECSSPTKPADALAWAEHAHKGSDAGSSAAALTRGPQQALIQHARALGYAFGLITIAANVQDDARERRLYLPLSNFTTTSELLAVMSGLTPPEHLVIPLLDISDKIRTESVVFTALPRGARRDLSEIFAKAASAAKRVRAGYAK